MATIRRAAVVSSLYGVEPAQLPFPEANSQTYKAGAVVTLTSGKVAEAGADPAAILGLSVADGVNNSVGAKVGVEVATLENIVEMNVKGTAGANNSALADVGVSYGIIKDSSGHWVVDKDEVTNKRVTVVSLVDKAGTANGRVRCTWNAANLMLFRAN